MQNCEEKCLFPGCTMVYSIYANYSRFHGLCLQHFTQYSPQDYSIPCEICNNTIKVYGYLPNREKNSSELSTNFNSDNFLSQNMRFQKEIAVNQSFEENKQNTVIEINIELPKKSTPQVSSAISEETSQRKVENFTGIEEKPKLNQENLDKSSMIISKSACPERNFNETCCFPYCKVMKSIVKVCTNHNFCEKHIEKYEGFYICSACKCSVCNKYSTVVVKCGRKFCKNCYHKRNCCCICCISCKKQSENCFHYFCDEHDSKYFCPCKTCTVCKESPIKKRKCESLLCDTCLEFKSNEEEKNSYCSRCNEKNTTKEFFCQTHLICKKCENKCMIYYAYPKCYLCNEKYSCKICFSYLVDKSFTCDHRVCKFCRKKSNCIDCGPNPKKL